MIRAMRPIIVAGNWKMHTTPDDAGELAARIGARTREAGVIRVLCPPFVCLAAVRDAVAAGATVGPDGGRVAVGAQDVHPQAAGAYTGAIAAPMLRGLAEWVIVGHSERRRDAGESDELVGRKAVAALGAGIRPILCVGEGFEVREAGRAEAHVAAQIRAAVEVLLAALPADALAPLVVAYEPIWAIGTGRTATGADAAAMAEAIRAAIRVAGLGAAADDVPVLYGGSVTSANVGEFLVEPAIDGVLVGGASLDPDQMSGIVARAALTAAARHAAGG